jgi:DNA-binding NtrC family response regulator
LLRAIQEREIDRIGGGKPVKINIRLIATSNRDLQEEVKKGTFREDLLFRLNVVNLRVPPLRERLLDVEVLARHFALKYADANGMPHRPIANETLKILQAQTWTGNVRELENTIHRAVLLAVGDDILPEAIMTPDGQHAMVASSAIGVGGQGNNGAASEDGESAGLVGRTVAAVERDLIIDTLYHCLGNRTHAANILGISIRTLRNKLKLYSDDGVRVPVPGEADRANA